LKTVDDYISNLTPRLSEVVLAIRDIILSSGPGIEECIKYKIPFYKRYSNICYINVRKEKIVDLGFTKGYLLSNHQDLLEAKGRAQVKTITFETVDDIDENQIAEIISEAILIDENSIN